MNVIDCDQLYYFIKEIAHFRERNIVILANKFTNISCCCLYYLHIYIYLGQMVYTVRTRCGQQLARESPCPADIVSTVPESATPAAMGFAKEVGRVEVACWTCRQCIM